jgi:hypothetical protein
VGSRNFIEKVKGLWGHRAIGRDVKEGNGGYQLRESAAFLIKLFWGQKNVI